MIECPHPTYDRKRRFALYLLLSPFAFLLVLGAIFGGIDFFGIYQIAPLFDQKPYRSILDICWIMGFVIFVGGMINWGYTIFRTKCPQCGLKLNKVDNPKPGEVATFTCPKCNVKYLTKHKYFTSD
jgi:hypothetical protein